MIQTSLTTAYAQSLKANAEILAHTLIPACAGDMFYVIEEGSFTVFNEHNQELARVGKGSCFGELALLRQVCASAGSRPRVTMGDGRAVFMMRDTCSGVF